MKKKKKNAVVDNAYLFCELTITRDTVTYVEILKDKGDCLCSMDRSKPAPVQTALFSDPWDSRHEWDTATYMKYWLPDTSSLKLKLHLICQDNTCVFDLAMNYIVLL